MRCFQVIPSVDISKGLCVKRVRGLPGTGMLIPEKPDEVAWIWERLGARRIHVVDLDGAVQGRPVNFISIVKLIRRVNCLVQVGGGIRSLEDAAVLLEAGARWVVLGSAPFKNPLFMEELRSVLGSGRIMVSLDVLDGAVMVDGWTRRRCPLREALEMIQAWSPAGVIVTAIGSEGALSGVDAALAAKVLNQLEGIPVFYAGGVSGLEDIDFLRSIGFSGVVLGMALYSSRIDLREAVRRYGA